MNGASLICSAGHTMNVARQGYVSLLGRDSGTHTADTAEMVAARERVFESGAFDPLVKAVAATASRVRAELPGGPVVDLGSGPGGYLAAVLETLPERVGLALDNSKFAARRAARAHPRIGSVVADVWDRVPVRDHSVALLINVFAPRNGEEMARVLTPGGRTIVVTPEPDHLHELVGPLGMITVDPDKDERLERTLAPLGSERDSVPVVWQMALDRNTAGDLVAMGPSAGRFTPAEIAAHMSSLPTQIAITGSIRIRLF